MNKFIKYSLLSLFVSLPLFAQASTHFSFVFGSSWHSRSHDTALSFGVQTGRGYPRRHYVIPHRMVRLLHGPVMYRMRPQPMVPIVYMPVQPVYVLHPWP